MGYKYVSGVEEVERNLLEFPVKVELKVIRGGLRTMANVVKKAIAPMVPVGKSIAHKGATSDLAGTLKVKSKKKGKTVDYRVTIGDKSRGVFYAHMVLGGTKPHLIRARPHGALVLAGGLIMKKVQHPGSRANPFMERGINASKDAAIKAGFAYYDEQVKKLADEDTK